MTLRTLVEGIEAAETRGDLDTEVTGISYDTRRTARGDIFVALRGGKADGHDFIGQAIERGAAAVLHEGRCPALGVPSVRVSDSRAALARLAANFHGRPSERLALAGVTGTNGKTTVTYLLKSILEAGGRKTGLIGTISYMMGGEAFPAPFTTPEAPEFQGLLARMLRAGVSHVASEVSSHALAQRRGDCSGFRTAVFTNLTRDHLDFHGDMESYFKAKERLFKELLSPSGTAVINADDPYGRRLISGQRGNVISYSAQDEADLFARDITMGPEGLSFGLVLDGGEARVESALTGPFNVQNILAAAGAALALGASAEDVVRGVGEMRQVRGRFEKVDMGQGFLLVIDYAHTEDALRRLLLAARQVTAGRLITVFGCGGDRDRGKRPAMGRAASELSDVVFITSDNPRSEDPIAIIEEIKAGAGGGCEVVPDRAEAIERAVMAARPSDTVVIAGKGHEDYQEIKGVRRHFSDREAAEAALSRRGARRTG